MLSIGKRLETHGWWITHKPAGRRRKGLHQKLP